METLGSTCPVHSKGGGGHLDAFVASRACGLIHEDSSTIGLGHGDGFRV